MGNGLENRLRKLEKTVRAQEDDIDQGAWRESAKKLRRTPEGRAAVRAYCERIFRAMHEQERKRIEAMTSSEQLARLRIQWAKEDTESETREGEYLRQAKVTPEDLESFLCGIIGYADGDRSRKKA
jgi:hypothetical protein